MKHQSSRPSASGSGSGSGRPAHNFGGRNAGHKPKGPSKSPAKSKFPGARGDDSRPASKSFGSKTFDRAPRKDEPMSKEARQAGYDSFEPRKIALPSREGSTGVRLNRHSALAGRGLEKDESFLDELFTEDRTFLFLILDGVQDPHNLGACLRSADGAGVDAVIIPRDRAAPITEIVHQVSCGATESIPVVRVTNLTRTIEKLKKHGVWTVGTSDRAEQLIYDVDLTGSMALIMGGEGPGMRRLTTENCDFLTKLPMAGKVECLNVSVATGVCLYEIVRQRLAKA
ncbi:MAG: hypothetical protein RL095_63 [Verrucomicrobiota bacterium]|jgi:23S rRNA (guanosine2251-2'-O)-methyltransferase